MTDTLAEQAAERFWAAAGRQEPFPRDLEGSVVWALPLAIVKLPGLYVADVSAWLDRRRVACRLDYPDRALRAALVAYGGRGLIFLDGTDRSDEKRFSLAHEVAHFLLDYTEPRRRATARFGESVLAVLDGHRAPTVEERLSAVLSGIPIGFHTHLMGRGSGGTVDEARVASVERRADRLAMELIAPGAEVHRRVTRRVRPTSLAGRAAVITEVLIGEFGLPLGPADDYARALLTTWYDTPTIRQWLGN